MRARVVLCSSDLASVEHFAIVSLRMYCSRSVFFNLYGVFSIFQAWFSSTRANPGFVRMKQIKMTARLIRTCDTCAHPYLYSSRTRYLVPGIYYDTATLLKQCSCVVPGRCTSRFCCMSFELSCCYYSLRRWGGGSTGVIQEPRHRPLLLVSYRTARIRELPPPADWSGH